MQSKILSILAFAAAAITAGNASPTGQYPREADVTVYAEGVPATQLETRQQKAGVYLCNDINFKGYCVHIVQPVNQCVNLSGDLNDKVSSVGPDSPFYCLFYSAFDCNDAEGHFGTFNPGYKDLRSVNFNDKISSYVCYPN